MKHEVTGVFGISNFGGIEVSVQNSNSDFLYYRYNFGTPQKWQKVKIYETMAGRLYFKASGKRIHLDQVMRVNYPA